MAFVRKNIKFHLLLIVIQIQQQLLHHLLRDMDHHISDGLHGIKAPYGPGKGNPRYFIRITEKIITAVHDMIPPVLPNVLKPAIIPYFTVLQGIVP